jgi:hypothetical protein
MSLVSALGCGTWFFPIEEQLFYSQSTGVVDSQVQIAGQASASDQRA